MGRAPCCAKVGLKKGAWSAEEDEKLVAFVNNHGHPNWRALPKQAGLLRCGKSCRLRWMNYLRPDIRRGNFTPEEEDLIITLHHSLGNRWSAIAAQLPGRTDNEIKNIWHTNLKKKRTAGAKDGDEHQHRKPPEPNGTDDGRPCAASPSRCSSAGTCSSAVTESTADDGAAKEESSGGLPPPLDESFWSSDVMGMEEELSLRSGTSRSEDMEFWFRLLYEAGGMEDLDAL